METPNFRCEIYVGNIPHNKPESELIDLLSKVGKVVGFQMKKNKDGSPAGFGFCEYESHEVAERAVKELKGLKFYDRILRISFPDKQKSKIVESAVGGNGGGSNNIKSLKTLIKETIDLIPNRELNILLERWEYYRDHEPRIYNEFLEPYPSIKKGLNVFNEQYLAALSKPEGERNVPKRPMDGNISSRPLKIAKTNDNNNIKDYDSNYYQPPIPPQQQPLPSSSYMPYNDNNNGYYYNNNNNNNSNRYDPYNYIPPPQPNDPYLYQPPPSQIPPIPPQQPISQPSPYSQGQIDPYSAPPMYSNPIYNNNDPYNAPTTYSVNDSVDNDNRQYVNDKEDNRSKYPIAKPFVPSTYRPSE